MKPDRYFGEETKQRTKVLETCWLLLRIEVAGDIRLWSPTPTQDLSADDNDD